MRAAASDVDMVLRALRILRDLESLRDDAYRFVGESWNSRMDFTYAIDSLQRLLHSDGDDPMRCALGQLAIRVTREEAANDG